MPRSSSAGVGEGAAPQSSTATQQGGQQGGQQSDKSTLDKTAAWQLKTQELAIKIMPCRPDPAAPNGVRFMLKSEKLRLSDAEGKGLGCLGSAMLVIC